MCNSDVLPEFQEDTEAEKTALNKQMQSFADLFENNAFLMVKQLADVVAIQIDTLSKQSDQIDKLEDRINRLEKRS